MKYIAHILITFVLMLLGTSNVYAQEVVSSIKPAFQHIISQPGKTIYTSVTSVTQGDPQVYMFKIYTLGEPDRYGNMQVLPYNSEAVTITLTDPYIRFDVPYLVSEKLTDTIPVRIDINENAADGEYAFVIVNESQSQPVRQGAVTASIQTGAGSVFFVTVSRNGIDNKQIETQLFEAVTSTTFRLFGSNIKIANSNAAVPVMFQIHNKGTYMVLPQGELSIKNLFNGKEEHVPFIPTYVFPGADRSMEVTDFDFETCLDSFSRQLCSHRYSYIMQTGMFGAYELSAAVQYGEGAPISYARDYFVVLPIYPLLGFLIIALLLLVFVSYEWYKHFKNNQNTPPVHRLRKLR